DHILYQRYIDGFWSLARISIDGGEPEALTKGVYIGEWNVSSDGEWLAYLEADGSTRPGHVVVRSLSDPNRTTNLDLVSSDFLAFTPDNTALITKPSSSGQSSQSTIWEFPLDGGKPQQLITNPPDNIYSAAYSPEKRLAWVQGRVVSNVVL